VKLIVGPDQNMEYKKEWNIAFEKYLRELDSKKPVIWGGDFNCAPTDKDIRHAKPNWNKTPVSWIWYLRLL
jgi:AP endonuclease-1